MENKDNANDFGQNAIDNEEELIAPIGIDESGNILYENLNSIPHFLICGFSGSGKTSFVQSVTTHIIQKYSSEKVKFIIFDSKIADYSSFKGMPHLLFPIIYDPHYAISAISWISSECQKRLKMFFNTFAKDIFTYNTLCKNNDNEKLPHIFVILDDFSYLKNDKVSYEALNNILNYGRKAGIHLVLVSATTSSKVLKKDLVFNFPCRISFSVPTKAESKMVIGIAGADELSFPGQIIFKCKSKLIKCQCYYMTDDEIDETISKFRNIDSEPVYSLEEISTKQTVSNDETESDEDELLPSAIEIVVDSNMASTTLLQRKLNLGYARAARIMYQMEELGIIGPFKGSYPRQVLITKEQWLNMNKDSTADHDINSSNLISSSEQLTQNKEPADIEMRNFTQFCFNDIKIYINKNEIVISKKIQIKNDYVTAKASFNGKCISGLIYKKPSVFSKGYFQIKIKPNLKIINGASDTAYPNHNDISNFLKIEFERNIATKIKSFMMQISEDTGIALKQV